MIMPDGGPEDRREPELRVGAHMRPVHPGVAPQPSLRYVSDPNVDEKLDKLQKTLDDLLEHLTRPEPVRILPPWPYGPSTPCPYGPLSPPGWPLPPNREQPGEDWYRYEVTC